MLPLLLFFLVFSATAVADENSKLIFILAGQSNMAGRGGVSGDRWDHFVPLSCAPNPRVLRLNANSRWELAREPLQADIDVHKACGVGPGMAFANEISKSMTESSIGLVPCAVGGTRVTEWERGRPLYNALVRRTLAAVKTNGGRSVVAMLWFQGESDTVRRADAEVYGARLQRMIRDLREDLGIPALLVIQVALASGEGKYIDIVREAQKSLKLSHVVCIDAKGLPLENDHLHLTTHAQVQLGQMLAAAYLNHSAISRNQ